MISITLNSSNFTETNFLIKSDIVIIDSNTIAYWNFNENHGSILYDSSEYGNNGTIVNAVWTEGWNKTALEFDGDDYIEFPYSTSFQSFQEGFTIEIFFKLTSYGFQGGCCLFMMSGDPYMVPTMEDNLVIYASSIPNDNKTHMVHNWVHYPFPYQPPLNEWILLDLVAEPRPIPGSLDYHLYINGTHIFEANLPDILNHDNPEKVYIGIDLDYNWVYSDYFYGIIDEFAIYHTYFDSITIQERYNYYANLDNYPPEIISSGDYSYSFGTSNNFINWTLYDENPKYYEIYKDNLLIFTNDWVNGTELKWNVDSLAVGVYNYTLLVSDFRDNIATDTIFVEVLHTINEFSISYSFLPLLSIILPVLLVKRKRKRNS